MILFAERIKSLLVLTIIVSNMPFYSCYGSQIKEYAAMPDGVIVDTINDYDEAGRTPLLLAARVGYLDAVLNIIKAGANITKPSQFEWESAVYLAAEGGHDIVVSALIRAGADIEYPNKLGITPVFAAAQAGYTRTVKALVESGASIGRVSQHGLTPLMIAAMRGRPSVMGVLLNADPSGVNMSSSIGETVLMSAIISRNVKCVLVALDAGADIDAMDRKQRTALMYAASRNLVDIMQALIVRGGDMDKKDKYGDSALNLAHESHNREAVNILLSAGAALTITGGIRMDETIRGMRRAVLQARDEARRLAEEKGSKILDFPQRTTKKNIPDSK